MHDRAKGSREQRLSWAHSRRAETHYAIQLRKLAKQIGVLIFGGIDDADPSNTSMIEYMLRAYADMITPWATATARRMLADVENRDRVQWARHSRTMSREIIREIEEAPTGAAFRALMDEQVELIRSLPLQAAQRVHDVAIKGISEGARGEAIIAEIMQTGHVTRSRATLIARTETSRAASNLMQARAEHVGSTQYIWNTSGDADVREDHVELNGKTFEWNDPPIADKRSGTRANPGCIWNCRCFASPIIPDEL